MNLRYEYDSRNWFINGEHKHLDSGFRADSGFIPQVGIDAQEITVGRNWYGEPDQWWTRVRLRTQYEIEHDESGRLLEEEVSATLGIGGPWQSWLQATLVDGREFADGAMFDIQRIRSYVQFRPNGNVGFAVSGVFGDQVDYSNTRLADAVRLSPSVGWNINRHLLLNLDATYQRLDTKDGERIFDASVGDLRATWQFNLRAFLRVSMQYRSVERNPDVYIEPVDRTARDLARQLLFSYKLNPQTVFFLGYNDAYVNNDQLDGMTATDRSWFTKIGYAWTL